MKVESSFRSELNEYREKLINRERKSYDIKIRLICGYIIKLQNVKYGRRLDNSVITFIEEGGKHHTFFTKNIAHILSIYKEENEVKK